MPRTSIRGATTSFLLFAKGSNRAIRGNSRLSQPNLDGSVCKCLKTWWPGTESNRRRQPFQGWIRSRLSYSLQRKNAAYLSRQVSIYWDNNGTRFWPVKIASPILVPTKQSRARLKRGRPLGSICWKWATEQAGSISCEEYPRNARSLGGLN